MNTKLRFNKFIEKSCKIHNNRYNYSKVNYIDNKTKIMIICPIHGEFFQVPRNHLVGKGCYKCYGKPRLEQEKFIEKASVKYGNRYDYSLTNYINMRTKIVIICPEHGIFEQKARSHLKGTGCKACEKKFKKSLAKNLDYFLERSRIHHGNKYDYSKVKYINNNTKIIVVCPTHGEFEQVPRSHMSGNGCIKCDYDSKKLEYDEFVRRSSEIHNNKYDYSKVKYVNNYTKVTIMCPTHGNFEQMPCAHLLGNGCASCRYYVSKLSKRVLNFLGISEHKREKTIYVGKKRYVVDAYEPETNTIYEINGDYWHGNPNKFDPINIHPILNISYEDLYHKTIEKQTALMKAGYNFVAIWESDFNVS